MAIPDPVPVFVFVSICILFLLSVSGGDARSGACICICICAIGFQCQYPDIMVDMLEIFEDICDGMSWVCIGDSAHQQYIVHMSKSKHLTILPI